jgi:hypothetical protein
MWEERTGVIVLAYNASYLRGGCRRIKSLRPDGAKVV